MTTKELLLSVLIGNVFLLDENLKGRRQSKFSMKFLLSFRKLFSKNCFEIFKKEYYCLPTQIFESIEFSLINFPKIFIHLYEILNFNDSYQKPALIFKPKSFMQEQFILFKWTTSFPYFLSLSLHCFISPLSSQIKSFGDDI